MKSNEDKLYAKTIDLDAIYNCVDDKFFIRKCLESQNFVLSSQILKFRI